MSRSSKYHFYLAGITNLPYSGMSHKIESFYFESNLKNKILETSPRWTVYIDYISLKDSSYKQNNIFPHIICGWTEDDNATSKKYEFFMNESKNIVVHMTTGYLNVEGKDKLPIPKYMCDFLRLLVKKLEEWESQGSIGYFLGEYIPQGYLFET